MWRELLKRLLARAAQIFPSRDRQGANASNPFFNTLSGVYARGQKPSIHGNAFTCDEAGGVRSQQDRCANQLLRFAEAAHRCTRQKFAAAVSAVQQSRVQFRSEDAGG